MPEENKIIASFQAPVITVTGMEELSPYGRDILEWLAKGFPNRTIASRLGLTDGAARWHLRHVCPNLHVCSPVEAAPKYRSAKAATETIH